MPIEVRCTSCGTKYQIREIYIGKSARCNKCGTKFLVKRSADQEETERLSAIFEDCDPEVGRPGKKSTPDRSAGGKSGGVKSPGGKSGEGARSAVPPVQKGAPASKSVPARKPESGAPVGKAPAGNQAVPVRPANDRKPGGDSKSGVDRKSGADQKVPPNRKPGVDRKPGGNSKEAAFPFEGDNFDQLLSANLAESDSGAPVDEEDLAPAKSEKPKAKKKKSKPAKVAKPARRSAAVDSSEMLQGILYLILGGCFLFGSFYLYNELDEWEKHGEGPKRMNRIVVVAYQIGGKTGATVASFCLGLWIIYISIRQLRGQASGGE